MRIKAAVVTIVAIVASGVGFTSPAQADTPRCVSRTEFQQVRDGMTKTRVHGIFDVTGRLQYSGSSGEGREYRPCEGDPVWSYISVDYERKNGALRVWFKWRYISH